MTLVVCYNTGQVKLATMPTASVVMAPAAAAATEAEETSKGNLCALYNTEVYILVW